VTFTKGDDGAGLFLFRTGTPRRELTTQTKGEDFSCLFNGLLGQGAAGRETQPRYP
jgi:hypothetical protein